MQGGYSASDKFIEIGLDITPLLSYVNPGEDAKFFLGVIEKDLYNQGEGEIVNWSIMDYSNGGEEVSCEQENIPLTNNDSTFLSITKSVVFDKVEITSDELPVAIINEPYSKFLDATGGTTPYAWSIKINYTEEDLSTTLPNVSEEQLFPSNDDDGFVSQGLDFSFPFYGQEYDQITILTDGAIVFEEDFKYIRTEESIIGNRCITAYCADLQIYPALNDGIWYEGDEDAAIIKWQTSKFDEPSVFIEMAIKLYASGQIEFYYGSDITEGLNWASGISNGDGGSYTIAQLSNAFSIPNNYSTKFTATDFPQGMSITSDGNFNGIPQESDQIWDITFIVTDYDKIFASKTIQFFTLTTSIDNHLTNDVFDLLGYPNPVKDNVTISFGLESDDLVSFTIYNLKGQKVNSMIAEKKLIKGEHSFSWNCKDDNENSLPRGIYYGVLSSTGFTKSIKLVLVK